MTALLGLPVGYEWVVLLVVALLLFGGTRIAGMGKGAGRAIREFKEELKAPTAVEAGTSEPPEAGTTTASVEKHVPEALDAEIVAPVTHAEIIKPVAPAES